jgi:membrane protease YdiL (CAAX protease family)
MAGTIKRYPVFAFYVVALLIGGVFTAPFIASTLGLMPQIPFIVIFVAAFSASLAGVIVTAIISGGAGVKALLSRFLIWRFHLGWWLAALLLPAVAAFGAVVLSGFFGGRPLDLHSLQPAYALIPLLLIKVIQAGVGEEFGWRGFALPCLQRRHSALVSSIIVGLMHGLWHWPLYFVEPMTQYYEQVAWGFLPALLIDTVMVILWSVTYTWLYNNTRGSVLIAAFFHGVVPTWMTYVLVTGAFGGDIDLGPFVWYLAVFAVINGIIVAVYGPKHLSRQAERQMA